MQERSKSRHRTRVNLCTFILLSTFVGVFIGCLGQQIYGVHLRRRVISQVESSGGETWFAAERCGDFLFGEEGLRTRSPPGPLVLRYFLGRNSFREIRGARLSEIEGEIKQQISDLRGLGTLKDIEIHGSSTTDASLVDLNTLTSLEYVSICRSPKVTDITVERLAKLRNLNSLRLGDTSMTDRGLRRICGFQNLYSLRVKGTALTDNGLADLLRLTKLRHLQISGVQITNNGLYHLRTLSQLRSLKLRSGMITDEGMRHLVGLTELESLDLRGTSVSHRGVVELQAAIPACDIFLE